MVPMTGKKLRCSIRAIPIQQRHRDVFQLAIRAPSNSSMIKDCSFEDYSMSWMIYPSAVLFEQLAPSFSTSLTALPAFKRKEIVRIFQQMIFLLSYHTN